MIALTSTMAIHAYVRHTEPDRSTPAVTVEQFLQAVFIDRNEVRVGLFVSREWTAREALDQTYPDVSPKIRFKWAVLDVTYEDEDHAETFVRMDLIQNLDIPGRLLAAHEVQRWYVRVVRQSGWRVRGVRVDTTST